jgi:hypothetical protein
MGTTENKAALLERIEEERGLWEALLAEVGEGRMEEPGVNGVWTFKDMMSHLIAYRRQTVGRLQAGAEGTAPPPPPWPPEWDDNDEAQLDRINAYIYEANRDRPLTEVLAESRAQFGQMRDAVAALSDDALFTTSRFTWLEGWPLAAVLDSSYQHLHEEHEPDIRAWLGRINQ